MNTRAWREAKDEELSVQDTVRAGEERELGTRDTQLRSAELGTLETIAPTGATVASELPTPELDRLEAAQIKGAIMRDLFDATAPAARIGRFTVLERLGEGGMGVVYAAYDEQLDRKVAVKVLRGGGGREDRSGRVRLLREAQAMARLSHPNLITVHEVGEHDDQVYVAMEFVAGRDLDAWLRTGPSWREVVDVFVDAAAGVAAAHAAGILHRDLKPHNIMRGDDGRVKVLDFGLARARDASERPAQLERGGSLVDARLTRTGAILGTPAYMSPEQHEGADLDERSDQFSLCAALYEGLYAQLPFAGETMVELVDNARKARVRPPPASSKVPAWVERIVRRGLARDPAERFPSVDALRSALRRDPVKRRRRALAVAGFAALMAGGGFAASSLAAPPATQTCADGTEEIAAVWDAGRKATIEAAFVAADPRLGPATWSRVESALDARAEAWAAMRTEVCESHLSGRQSAALLDLRMACLDRRMEGLDALLTVFTSADEGVVLNAVDAVGGLSPLATCADVDALNAPIRPPENPRDRAQLARQRAALERVAAAQLTGRYREALSVLEPIAAAAEELAYPPLTAEVALARGRALQELTDDGADGALTEALTTGLIAGAEAIAAEAAARRLFVSSELLGEAKAAARDIPVVEALVARTSERPNLRWLWTNNAAVAQQNAEQLEEARTLYRRARDVARADGRPGLAAISTVNLGLLVVSEGRLAEAAGLWEESAAALGEHLGEHHPKTLRVRILAAQANAEGGRVDAARAALDEAVGPLAEHLGDDAREVLMARLLGAELDIKERRFTDALAVADAVAGAASSPGPAADAEWLAGLALLGLGRREEALARARAAVERAGDDGPLRVAQLSYLGDTLTAAGLYDEAAAAHREALDAALAALGEEAPRVAIIRSGLGRALLARGDLEEARVALTQAVDALRERHPESPYLTRAYATLGAIERARGDLAAAENALRIAVDRASDFDARSLERADLQLALAELLRERADGTTTAEAAGLAEAANDTYRARGAAFTAELAATEALAER
jgi:tetratricopeptide (TPR) repeat protein/predicted Ser/Thr protein kinase